MSPNPLCVPVKEGGAPVNVTAMLQVTSEKLQGKRLQLVLQPEQDAVRPATSKLPGIFIAPYALVVLSTPELPDDSVSATDAGSPPPAAAASTFAETQMGIIPADPANPDVLLRSWVYLPELFFKDEGSKDRCMEAEVALVAANKSNPGAAPVLVKGIKLHLNVQLVYVDFVPSPEFCSSGGRRRAGGTQLLHVSSATVKHIDPNTGRAKIKFRVNDVSKNHDGRFFRLAIAADLSDSVSGEAKALIEGPVVASQVAPAFTHAIEVRSKRRKTKGKTAAGSATPSSVDFDDMGGGRAMSAGSAHAGAAAAGALRAAVGTASATLGSHTPQMAASLLPGSMPGGIEGVPRGHHAKQLKRSMNEVVNWSNNVLDLLQSKLQWHTFQNKEGTVMVKCIVCGSQSNDVSTAAHFADCKLQSAVKQYSDSTRESITALVRHIHGEQNMLAAQRKAAERKAGIVPAVRSNSLENEIGGNTAVPRATGISAGPSPHDAALAHDQDAVQSLVQLRNSPPVPAPGPPPALARDESAGAMFVRVTQQHQGLQHSQQLSGSSDSSAGHAVGGHKRAREATDPYSTGSPRRPSRQGQYWGDGGDDMGPATLERESSRMSYASMGPGDVHDMSRMAAGMPPTHAALGRMPSGLAPGPPGLVQQASFTRQDSGQGWPMQFVRQDSGASWGPPGPRLHAGSGMVPPPPGHQPFLRGNSSSTSDDRGGAAF